MMRANVLLPFATLVVAACVHVPRVAPEARWGLDRTRGTVQIDVSCGTSDRTSSGTGVMVSERHVLTAAHVVDCADIPTVRVTYLGQSGPRTIRMVVTREDADADIARLEIASAESFQLGIKPPLLRAADPGNEVCAELALAGHPSRSCGTIVSEWTVAANMQTQQGDSGAPVFCDRGTLVGLVITSGVSDRGRPYSRITPIDDSWISDLVPQEPGRPSPWKIKRPPMTAEH